MVMSWEGFGVGGRGDTGTLDRDEEVAAVTVAALVGVSTSTLGAWDRYHGIGPYHDLSGRQGYNRADILGVGLMPRITARGVPAGDAARVVLTMNTAQLQAQLDGMPQDDTDDASGARNSGEFVLRRVKVIVEAATNLDVAGVSDLYAETLEKYGLVTAWTDVLAPSLRRIGRHWEQGLLGVESEHLASHLLTRELTFYNRCHRADRSAPITVLLASAEGDLHSLPLQVVEAELARCGVRCIALGANVPAGALATAMTRHRPHHVLLWASLNRPGPDPTWEHLRTVEHTAHIVTAGPGWVSTAQRDPHGCPGPWWVDHATGLRQALHLLTVPGLVSHEPAPEVAQRLAADRRHRPGSAAGRPGDRAPGRPIHVVDPHPRG